MTGYPEDRLVRSGLVLRSDGTDRRIRARPPACVRRPIGRPSAGSREGGHAYRAYREFHAGRGALRRLRARRSGTRVRALRLGQAGGRATGVLEAGFHISRQRRLQRVQIEALRGLRGQVAVAVETARLYEDVTARAPAAGDRRPRSAEPSPRRSTWNRRCAWSRATCSRAVDASHLPDRPVRGRRFGLVRRGRLGRRRTCGGGGASSGPSGQIVFEVADAGADGGRGRAEPRPGVLALIARLFGIRSLLALPLTGGRGAANRRRRPRPARPAARLHRRGGRARRRASPGRPPWRSRTPACTPAKRRSTTSRRTSCWSASASGARRPTSICSRSSSSSTSGPMSWSRTAPAAARRWPRSSSR